MTTKTNPRGMTWEFLPITFEDLPQWISKERELPDGDTEEVFGQPHLFNAKDCERWAEWHANQAAYHARIADALLQRYRQLEDQAAEAQA